MAAPVADRSNVEGADGERTLKGKTTHETAYFVTSLSPKKADSRRLLDCNRTYWEIESWLYWMRDVTFGEDHSQVRSGASSFRKCSSSQGRADEPDDHVAPTQRLRQQC